MLIQTCPARDSVRIAIAGVGNCASSFVQGLHYYREMGGPLIGPSSYFMKSPPRQFSDEEARAPTLRYIAGAN